MKRKARSSLNRARSKRSKIMSRRNRGGLSSFASPSYRGPIRTSLDASQVRTVRAPVQLINAMVTNGTGQLAQVFSNNPNSIVGAAPSPNWGSFAVVYDEYRVLGMRVQFVPINPDNQTLATTFGITIPPIATVIDRDLQNALIGYSGASGYYADNYESCYLCAGNRPFIREARGADFDDAQYINTTSPAATYFVKFWAAGFPNTTTVGYCFTTLLVEFRGRGT